MLEFTVSGADFQAEHLDFDAGWLLGVELAALLGAGGVPKSLLELSNDLSLGLDAVVERLPLAIMRAGTALLGKVLARTYWLDESKGKTKRVCLNTPDARNRAFGNNYALAVEVLAKVIGYEFQDSLQAIALRLGALLPAPTA